MCDLSHKKVYYQCLNGLVYDLSNIRTGQCEYQGQERVLESTLFYVLLATVLASSPQEATKILDKQLDHLNVYGHRCILVGVDQTANDPNIFVL